MANGPQYSSQNRILELGNSAGPDRGVSLRRLAEESPRGSRPVRRTTPSLAEPPPTPRPSCAKLCRAGPARLIAALVMKAVEIPNVSRLAFRGQRFGHGGLQTVARANSDPCQDASIWLGFY